MYSNIVTGKLKLKGSTPEAPSHGKKKKKSKKDKEPKEEVVNNNNNDNEEENSAIKVSKTLTEAEKRHREKLAKKEQKRIDQLVSKSHKEKIEEYNKYLSSLSEHHDVPKVGPG
ncbi:hypothetical protein DICPUDRAFT_91389 [Dictyostelium purpureum]|uniref:DUF1754-domain-containing protein n=1 Tax=Dictyostelium purpureum TaxID=5786 RepID=F0ZBL8_DICPU|nr:uncharacterized protein DICPUDRAFT_91389 [Dictyostelium purpureum]EGC38618.1 hypothetical protein DICPUDRAFT_91389 [Dictyostelium purpureum]|eukprot:XP_003284811.1 hypothetical protein DICPUDRAFT_91389 [Dictyostelium purpureum]